MPSDSTAPTSLAASVAAAFGDLPEVVAVALAGSWGAGAADENSDIDLYVYAAEPIALADRGAIATSFGIRTEVGNEFWEPGDEWIDAATGRHVDIMYRTPRWIEARLERVLVHHEASVGYSTCFWHNVRHSTPLYDRSGWYRDLQTVAARPYPEPLRRNIIARNHPILRQSLSSYRTQIERAVLRADSVSIQHRVTALLASYFDVLFAVNELTHPGEKRLLQFAATRCAKTPPAMETQVNALLEMAARPATLAIVGQIDALIASLDALLVEQNLLPLR